MVPNRRTGKVCERHLKPIWCDEIAYASCYASSDAFRIIRQMRADGYSVAVTGYSGSVLTPFSSKMGIL